MPIYTGLQGRGLHNEGMVSLPRRGSTAVPGSTDLVGARCLRVIPSRRAVALPAFVFLFRRNFLCHLFDRSLPGEPRPGWRNRKRCRLCSAHRLGMQPRTPLPRGHPYRRHDFPSTGGLLPHRRIAPRSSSCTGAHTDRLVAIHRRSNRFGVPRVVVRGGLPDLYVAGCSVRSSLYRFSLSNHAAA